MAQNKEKKQFIYTYACVHTHTKESKCDKMLTTGQSR